MKNRFLCMALSAMLLSLSVPGGWTEDTSTEIRRNVESAVGRIVRLKTEGRGEFQGRLLSVSDDRVEIQNVEGLILFIALDQVTEVLIIDPSQRRDTYFQDAAANKLIVMPVGFGMESGELHIADQEIVIVSCSYGFSEHFSLWTALSIPGALLNARFSTDIGSRAGISAGSFVGIVFVDPGSVVVLPYVLASFGSPHQNLTIGLGAPFYTDSIIDPSTIVTGGVVAVGGKIVLSPTASLVTENWITVLSDRGDGRWYQPGVFIFPAVAIRIAGSRFSWDVGVIMPFSVVSHRFGSTETGDYTFDWLLGEPIPLPILGFTYRIR